MGKWTCHCGQLMNDHHYPDPNCYQVYSEELWDKITDRVDEENHISFYDIDDATFVIYKYPSCSGIMIFGEDEMPNRYTFYKKVDLQILI